ncbi:MAG: NAD-dependent dehydratase [Methylotenera sp.]|nr:MAG: NAD-dependent dehydratase [Methylotenera sp.]
MARANINSVLVTGANGFVGNPLCEALAKQNWNVRGAVRSQIKSEQDLEWITINDVNRETDWSEALKDIDVVIHLAARVHIMEEKSANPLAEFREVNVEGTRQLAIQAANAGIKRLVYVSSIKVNGEKTMDKPFDESDPVDPQDAYGVSKYEAELALHEVAANTGLEIVIVRPPLIYGPGVKGNFLQLIKVINTGFPLPFASINNLRSLLYVGNLVDAMILCATHPNAAGKTYLISDGDDVSTPGLIKAMAEASGHKARLISCPTFLLKCLSNLVGKKEQMNRLFDSLQLDNRKLMHDLGWKPKFSFSEGLKKTFEVVNI